MAPLAERVLCPQGKRLLPLCLLSLPSLHRLLLRLGVPGHELAAHPPWIHQSHLMVPIGVCWEDVCVLTPCAQEAGMSQAGTATASGAVQMGTALIEVPSHHAWWQEQLWTLQSEVRSPALDLQATLGASPGALILLVHGPCPCPGQAGTLHLCQEVTCSGSSALAMRAS